MNELYITEVPGKGRGVFSKRHIKAGEIVETAPVVIIPGTISSHPEKHEYIINGLITVSDNRCILPKEINRIIFNWSFLSNNGKKDRCIALGYGSLYNSANPSNMRYEADEKSSSILFIAVVDIAKDTELTINYSGVDGSYTAENNYWFNDQEIKFN